MRHLRPQILVLPLCILMLGSIWAIRSFAETKSSADTKSTTEPRFVVFDARQPVAKSRKLTHCILDKKTQLVWEVKSDASTIQNASQTYSWYEPDGKVNGGFSGYRNRGICKLNLCNTHSYIAAMNKEKLCGLVNWRLPSREELRSLVDYNIPYPGPSISKKFFPNTRNQFYWSATANANDRETAWGIGFSFGYDYAYFKSDHGYIRLVSGPN